MKDHDWLQTNLRKMRVASSVATWENYGIPPWQKTSGLELDLDGVLEQVAVMLIYHHRQTNAAIDRPTMAEMSRARLGLVAHPVEFREDKVNGRAVEEYLNNNYIVAFDIAGVGFLLDTMTFSLSMAVPSKPAFF